uniref:WD_REPEATS_REGION domain-containing protein n=1 Tax=Mesocestoides corti TaxID=53468 RepID=A0A5K3F019_MESCO
MKVLTPEIAWHETLPIYSCDLQPVQPSTTPVLLKSASEPRPPLAELPISAVMAADEKASAKKQVKAPPRVEGAGEAEEEEATEAKQRIENAEGESWTRLATAGGDNMVRLWRVNLDWTPPSSVTVTASKRPLPKGMLQGCDLPGKKAPATAGGSGVKVSAAVSDGLVFLATLKRHERLVNVVRWSPSGKYLASAGDDQFVIIWHRQRESEEKPTPPPLPGDEMVEPQSIETWLPLRCLRRHLEDIYDLCWSPDDENIISGSVDQSAIIWQLDLSSDNTAGSGKAVVLRDHKHYVQGVAWDPLGVFAVSMSSDRTCRVYNVSTKQCIATISKADKHHLFQDDSWKSFFRRPAISPDGLLLICPAGNLETAVFAGDMASAVAAATNKSASIASDIDAVNANVTITSAIAPQHAAHIFLRSQLNNKGPCLSLPTGPRPVIAVRFCPQPFQLRMTNPEPGVACTSLFQLPYRWLFCLVLEDGLLFFDTQQAHPFAQVSQIHYQALNDAAWSSDGRLVAVTSTDGYCSLIHFSIEELGTPYRGALGVGAASASATTAAESVTREDAPIVDEVTKPVAMSADPKNPQVKVIGILKSESRRHISFQPGTQTPERPHTALPVTPNTGRFLSEPVQPSPTATPPPAAVGSAKEKRRVEFITLSYDVPSTPTFGQQKSSFPPPQETD